MSKNERQYEFTAEGVHIETEEHDLSKAAVKKVMANMPPRGRQLTRVTPTIYVNDGSGGSNLKYTYSYKVYNENGSKPSISNHYTNDFPRDARTFNSTPGGKLHPTGDSGGYSDYNFPTRK